jgi:ABC-type phosphate transport system substrate-binding protein
MKKILLVVLLGMLMSFKMRSSGGTSIAIIINKDNPVSALTAGEVKLYWLRKIKKRWPEINKNIKPADFKARTAAQETFYGTVLKMTGSDVDTYFTQKQYESAEKPQDKLSSNAAMIDFIAGEPGAIGYIESSALSADDKAKVKVVLIVN